jgi:anti-sigma regulatory factor (Ser/Thr protein kinase)
MSVVGSTHSKSYPVVSAAIPEARSALTKLATSAGAAPDVVESVRLAVSEALTNVVLHAYDDDPGRIQVTAAALSDELWILISDDGRGLHARTDSPGLGLGLMLVSQVADDFSIVSRASGGTEVRIRFNLDQNGRSANGVPAGVIGRVGIGQLRGSLAAASRPASARFSTTT